MSTFRKVYCASGATRTYVDDVLVDGTEPTQAGTPMIMPDLDAVYGGGFVSSVDGTLITSRSNLREHNIRNGVIQSGDLRGDEFKAAMKKRMRYNPEARTANGFTWKTPRSSGGNISEI